MKQRKFLSLMFAFAFLLSLLPANVTYAADYAGGSGTASSPYLISNLTQFKNFRNNVNSGNTYSGKYFKMTADIDLGGSSSDQWTPIADNSDYCFEGTFNGDGHKITGLYIKVDIKTWGKGLFGYVGSSGTVKNLDVSGIVEGGRYVGGVAGTSYGTIENCCNNVDVNPLDLYGGGIVGKLQSGTVKNCYNTQYIYGNSRLGGIVGENESGIVENCYNTEGVRGTSNIAIVGGIVGENNSGTVKNCYNIGIIQGKYRIGGVVGYNTGTVTSCYYVKGCNASGTTFTNTDGTVLTAAQMQDKSNYSGWDFSNTWYMVGSRPLLRSNFEINLKPTTDKYDLDGDGTNDTVYEISTADEFVELGAAVNNGNRKLNVVLTKDIDLSGHTWSPIGVYNSDFEGIFDGQNHTISNMKFTTVQHGYGHLTYDYQGLFGVIRNGAIVRNFTVKGDITLAADGQEYIGGVVGLAYGEAKISNVISYVNITDGGTAYSDIKWIGGVVGQIGTDGKTSGYIDWCKYYGKINVDTAAKVGGIVGCAVKDSYVTNSTNYGKVGWNYIGHIAGIVGSATTGTHVVNCANYGEVSANCHDCIGGVVGYANQYVTINNCLNGGKISGQPASGSDVTGAYIGGILGYINNSNFAGLNNCFNYGTVKNLGGTDTYVGALVGWLRNGATNVKDNYYLTTSCAKACGGNDGTNNTSVTAIQAASGEIAYKLQGSQSEQVWGQSLTGENYETFPVLGGAKVYSATKCNGIVTYANTVVPTSHSYSNGVCQNCGASQTISKNSDGYYEIGSKAEYIHFTNLVNSNGEKDKLDAVLTSDIDLLGYDYIPIGKENTRFIGTFDGAGHKIENMTMTANNSYMGMFGRTNGATVKNFTVSGNITAVCDGLENIGGIIGLADSTSVSDVISKVNFKDNGKIEHIYRAGGIAAQARKGSSFKNCEYSGDITLHFGSHTTGIVGVTSDASKDTPNIIENCVNKANMKFDISRRVAGMIGWNDTYTTVSKCANYGNITIKESDGTNQAAGIVAVNVGPLTVEDCANYGNITDGKVDSSVGGIVGFLDVYQNTSDFGGIANCFNYGTITNTNENGSIYWGAVIGYIKNDTANTEAAAKITNNYYLENTAPTISGTNGIALTATKVSKDTSASGELAHTLQGSRTDTVWGQTITGNDTTAYPVPNGDRVYKVTFVASDKTYATKYANTTGVGTLPENPDDKFAKWLCGNTADSAEFTATTPINSDMTVYAFKTDTPQASETSDQVEIVAGAEVAIDLRNYVKSAYGSNFVFSVADGSTLPQGLSIADDGYTIVGTANLTGTYTVTFNVKNNNIALFSMNDDGTLLTLKFVVAAAFEGEGMAENPYLIKTTDDLIKFRDQVTSGLDFAGKFIKLTTDIDLEGSETNQWTPIGSEDNKFKGTFDGDGHKISGLYIMNQDVFYQGLFGYVDTEGTVKDLSVYGNVSARQFVGGVAGYNKGLIENCTNYADISGIRDIGGVVGLNQGRITNSCNTGDVSGETYVGGVTGKNNYATIENSYNTGDVSGETYVSGVAGCGEYSEFINSYNTGKVSGNTQTGGVVGCIYYGEVTKCYNTGTISGNTQTGALFGVNKDNSAITIINSYYLDTCAADGTKFDNTDGVPFTAEQMQDSVNFEEWDFGNTWVMGYLSPMLQLNLENGTRNNPDKVISTVNGLKTFREQVNGGETFEGKYILLEEDLDLEGSETNQWTPIGSVDNKFKGTFDADGHKISGLYIASTSDYQGLFGCIDVGGMVKNLKVDGNVKGNYNVGGVTGWNDGKVKNCYNTGSVDGRRDIGGIVGYNNGKVKNCYNTGSVDGRRDVGGVVGYNDNYNIVENCSNTGSICGLYYVGGVVGCDYNDSGKVKNCYNTGSVDGETYVGGMTGGNKGKVENCYNTGNVDGEKYVGGVTGCNRGTVENCYNTGGVVGTVDDIGGAGGVAGYNNGKVKNCYNTGSVDGETYVGGVVGNGYGTVECCYYLNTCGASGYFGKALTAEKMKTRVSFEDWDFENTWVMGYLSPMLKSNLENGTKNTTTAIITSVDELKTFRDNVNGGKDYEGEYILLTADLDLGGDYSNNWMPIGSADNNFKGTFDGDGHKITGLFMMKPSNGYQGLFGYVGVGGIVKNLNVDGSIAGERNVGGITSINYGMIENCRFTGNVSSYAPTGGYVGGIVGVNNGTIKNCNNGSSITCAQGNIAGGITGYNYGLIENCHNIGNVTGIGYVGGIVGHNDILGGVVKNCYNQGNITGNNYIGGVVGYNLSTLTNCYNQGSITAYVGNVGGVTGYDGYNTVKNCYYLDTCAADGIKFTNEAGTALTAEQMKTRASFENWDFTGTWTMGNVSPYLKSIPETSTKNNPNVVISTADELKTFRDNVNSGKSYEGNYILLTADLDLIGNENDQWTAIGTGDNQFKGTFDGDGHKIKGLYINNTSESQGLFAYVGVGGTVKDLSVDGTVKGNLYIGGVVGTNSGLIEKCSFSGNAGGSNSVGGIAGNNTTTGTVQNCHNTGSVGSTQLAGGIVGRNAGRIKNSYNTGRVSGPYNVGGVAGANSGGTVENCYNTDDISGTKNVGGVVGNNSESKVTNCYNTGRVSVSDDNVGGVVGYNSDSTVENCYYLGTCAADGTKFTNEYGNALTAAQMKDSESFENWDFASTWAMGYLSPMLKSIPEKNTKNGADIISTVEELKEFRNSVNGGETFEGKYIVLAADLNLNGSESDQWTAIGSDNYKFKGIFDGDGHKISGLYIKNNSNVQGLFGVVGEDGIVKDLSVDGTVTGELYVGGVVGTNEGTVENCEFSGSVGGKENVGGVAGTNSGIIKNCRNTGDISVTDHSAGGAAGTNSGTIENSYNTGNISGLCIVGGVAGTNNKTIQNCYNTGNVSSEAEMVGGVTGNNNGTVKNCYNTGTIKGYGENIGGVVGKNSGSVVGCYYLDTCRAGSTLFDNRLGTSLTAEYMKDSAEFEDWDFDVIWVIKNNRPLLRSNIESKFNIISVGEAEEKATAKVYVPKVGTYTIVFADYENGRLNDCDIVSFTVTAENLGENTVTSTKEITLGKEDKIMIWDILDNFTPMCDAYKVK